MPITVPLLMAVAYWVCVLALLVGGNQSSTQTGPHIAARPLDELDEALRQFRRERGRWERIAFIKRFGNLHDPRVTLALMEEVVLHEDADEVVLMVASYAICDHHIPPGEKPMAWTKVWNIARIWWETAEPGIRRRAAAMSR